MTVSQQQTAQYIDTQKQQRLQNEIESLGQNNQLLTKQVEQLQEQLQSHSKQYQTQIDALNQVIKNKEQNEKSLANNLNLMQIEKQTTKNLLEQLKIEF